MYGTDSRYLHSNGLLDHSFATTGLTSVQDGHDLQLDLPQLYFDVAVPVGNGLRIRAGKFYTPIGFESLNSSLAPLYTRSFLATYAEPFTHTGVTGTYNLSDQWTAEVGVFRGWEQSLEDNNDAISYYGRLAWASADKRWSVLGQVVTGPEATGNDSDYRTLFNVVATHAPTEKLSFSLDAVYAFEHDLLDGGSTAYWYGAAGYVAYKVNDTLTINGRGEWFDDDDGARGLGTTLYEATLGLTIKPFAADKLLSNLSIRPEVRIDFADDDIFDDASAGNQTTLAVDVVFTF